MIVNTPPGPGKTTPTLLQNGFRPFFLLAGLYGALLIPLWLGAYLGDLLELPWPAGLFHGHELIFGFVTAAISGFLLTAVPNWERAKPTSGWALLILVIIWISGRIAMWSAGSLSPFLVMAIDVMYLPMLVIIGIPELFKSNSNRNKIFITIILLLALANVFIHLNANVFNVGINPIKLSLNLIVLLIAVLGGRVTPAFTSGGLGPSVTIRNPSKIDALAIGSIAILLIADIAAGQILLAEQMVPLLAIIAGVVNLMRMSGWKTFQTFSQPIVWVLHLGYGWLGVGLILRGVLEYGGMGPLAFHGLGVGAIGTMTLAIMSRAALGHSGRQLITPKPVVFSYVLISVAAVARLSHPLAGNDALIIAAGAWSLAFALFTITYLPIIALPRIKPNL